MSWKTREKRYRLKKGSEYPEFIWNASTVSVLVMFRGNVPIMGQYNEEGVERKCSQKVPLYNVRTSVWFDVNIFMDWLNCRMIPKLEKYKLIKSSFVISIFTSKSPAVPRKWNALSLYLAHQYPFNTTTWCGDFLASTNSIAENIIRVEEQCWWYYHKHWKR